MKKQRWAFYGCAALAAALFVLTFASCPTVSDNGNKINNGPKVVDGLDMTPLVPYPVGGTAVENAIDEQPEFTGTVAWEQIYGGGSLAFPEYGLNYTTGLDYRATVALTAKDGYTFKGAAADSFTHQYGGITNPAGDGNTLTLTIVFPKAPDANDQQVSATNLFESLPAPYRGGAPAASIDNSQYSGIVNWSTDSGTFTGAVFDPATIYTAKITLDTYGGYTLFGLSSHSFSHPLAQTVSFDAATDTVTVRFNKTAGLTEDSVVNLFNLSDSVKWPGQNETLTSTFENDQYTANVAWFNSSGGAISAVPASNFKAVVSMTAKTGFTFAGVAANSFFHSAKGVSSVSNDADGATATINFSTAWTIGTITYPSLKDKNIDICCYYDSNPASLLVDGTVSTSNYWDYGWDGTSPYTHNMTSWPLMQTVPFSSTECGHGHPSIFTDPSVPENIRKPGHAFTIDLGSVTNNIANFRFATRDQQRAPHEIEVFYSNNPIGPTPDINDPSQDVKSLGIYDFTIAATGHPIWYEAPLYQHTANGRGFSARYIQVRIYKTHRTGLSTETAENQLMIEPSFTEIQIGIGEN